MQQVIILGAGKSKQFIKNPAAIRINAAECALDWLLNAFNKEQSQYTFVGGYKFDQMVRKYPNLHFIFNPQWEKTSCDASLKLSGFDTKIPAFICYGDILLRFQLIEQMLQLSEQTDADVIVAFDSDRQLLTSKKDYETITGIKEDKEQPYPFIGCVYLKPAALKVLQEQQCFCGQLQEHRLSGIIEQLRKIGLKTRYVDAHGLWAEVLHAADVAKFILTTKAQTLYTLRKRVTKAQILDQFHFSIGQWQAGAQSIIHKILNYFEGKNLVVRSSSLQEDSFSQANAGKFESILNVKPNEDALKQAVETVIHSYGTKNDSDQVLVQPMLSDVNVCGVIFTRTLNYGAPYYVVNYDRSDTEAVTSGASAQDETFFHWKQASIPSYAPTFYTKLFEAVQEIEQLTQFDALDIEFAITKSGDLYIFQVRPMTSVHLREIGDRALQRHLETAVKRFQDLQTAQPDIQGEETIFGIMPDWNPAEIVGTKPHRLAISLYQTLITNEIWAQQRAEFGYKDVRPYPLIINFAGHPYVDVRASIHSFLPASLSPIITGKLVHFFVQRLKDNPCWHDKLEFMVMPTCYTMDFEDRWQKILINEAHLTEEEFQQYRSALYTLTQSAFEKCHSFYQAIEDIAQRFDRIKDAPLDDLDKIYVLLQTCKIGTLNFSHLARCGFIASSLLKSFVAKTIISEEEKSKLTWEVQTITGQFFETIQQVLSGKVSKEECIKTYGHLRPGTYDITSPTYRSNPEKYLFANAVNTVEKEKLEPLENENLSEYLQKTFHLSLSRFKQFLREAIAGREYSKFVFTRYISLVLDLIQNVGQAYGFSAEDMAHVPVSFFEDLHNGLYSPKDIKPLLKFLIDQGKEFYRVTQCIELPPLITQNNDFYAFFVPKTLPNFIGTKCVEAELVRLKNSKEMDGNRLKNCIILIEKADPGFDWIFNYEIAGLITAYGGPNSHMAIRSAEFNLPASIGVGEGLFNQLKTAKFVRLDCASHRLQIVR